MIEVKREKRSPSNRRNRRKIIVAGGENEGQLCHSVLRHPIWKKQGMHKRNL
jgi:hypothetical protein